MVLSNVIFTFFLVIEIARFLHLSYLWAYSRGMIREVGGVRSVARGTEEAT